MTASLNELVWDFALAFKAVDTSAPIGGSPRRRYRPGIGPLGERDAIHRALEQLKLTKPELYSRAGPRSYPGTRAQCDLVLPGLWALEFKLIRPFGDNGDPAEHWSENVLHPYEGNTSSIGDCLKLRESRFSERKAVIVFGYEHSPPRIDLELAVMAFEIVAEHVNGLTLGERYVAEFDGLIHPVHQQGRVYGWEVL